MIEKPCRCGKSKKNFNVDIGPFYIDECCEAAGYDEFGNRKEQKPLDPETKDLLEAAQNSTEAANLEVNDEGEQPEQAVDDSEPEQDSSEEEQAESEAVEAPESAPAAEESKSSKKNKNKNKNK